MTICSGIFMREAVKIFKALSDPTRLRILILLMRGDLCVCELVFVLKMEQSRISHQLRILRDADLVEDIRERKWTNYSIRKESKNDLELLFERLFGGQLFSSKEAKEDMKNLEICLKEEIRKKKCL